METIKYTSKDEMRSRQQYLFTALQHDSSAHILKAGERIAINQEIAALYRMMERYVDASKAMPSTYQLSQVIEDKISKIYNNLN